MGRVQLSLDSTKSEILHYIKTETAGKPQGARILEEDIKYISEKFWDDIEILSAFDCVFNQFAYISQRLRDNEEFILDLSNTKADLLSDYHTKFLTNKRIMLLLVRKNPSLFQYAFPTLQDDKELALAAVHREANQLQYASQRLRGNREVVLAAVEKNGMALIFASQEMRDDREVVLAAVRQNEMALLYASPRMRSDITVVRAAIQQNSGAFLYASDEAKKNPDLLPILIQAIAKPKPKYSNNQNTLTDSLLVYAFEGLHNNIEQTCALVQQNGNALKYASEQMRDNREVVLAAVQENGLALQWASDRLKNDPDIVFAAISKNGGAFVYASEELRSSKEFVLKVLNQSNNAYLYIADPLKRDREVVLVTVSKQCRFFEQVHAEFRADKEILLMAMPNNYIDSIFFPFRFTSDLLRGDAEVVYAAFSNKNLLPGFSHVGSPEQRWGREIRSLKNFVAPKLLKQIEDYGKMNKCSFDKALRELAFQVKIFNSPNQLYTRGAVYGLFLAGKKCRPVPRTIGELIGTFLLINAGGWQMACTSKRAYWEAVLNREENAFLPSKLQNEHDHYQKENKCNFREARRYFLLKEWIGKNSNKSKTAEPINTSYDHKISYGE